jgi:hypothetical protein
MGSDVEGYISEHAGRDLSKVFDQYLRTTMVPTLEYRLEGDRLEYRWANVVPAFDMPIDVTVADVPMRIKPTEQWQTLEAQVAGPTALEVDPDYYVISRNVTAGPREE